VPAPCTANFLCDILDTHGSHTAIWVWVCLYDAGGKSIAQQYDGQSSWVYSANITIAEGYSFKFGMIVAGFSVSGYTFVLKGKDGNKISIRGSNRIS